MEKIKQFLNYPAEKRTDIILDHLLEDALNNEIINDYKKNNIRRRYVFSASQLGSAGKSLCGKYTVGCARKLFFRYLGVPTIVNNDAGNIRRLNVGTDLHLRTQKQLTQASNDPKSLINDFKAEIDFNPQNNKLAKELEIASTMDGSYTYGQYEQEYVLEIKSMGGKSFESLIKPKAEHVTQVQIYMALADIPLANILYISLGFCCPIRSFIVPFNPIHWKAIIEKINYVKQCATKLEAPAEEHHFFCSNCEYRHLCKQKTHAKRVRSRKTFTI